jgi:hypothetical protein
MDGFSMGSSGIQSQQFLRTGVEYGNPTYEAVVTWTC